MKGRRLDVRRLWLVVVLALVAFVALLAGRARLSGNLPRTIDVPAQAGWVDTGVRLGEGAQVVMTATGRVYTDVVRHPDESFAPEGAPQTGASPGDPMPEANHAALIGRVGDQQFVVGRGPFCVKGGTGSLLVRVNDDRLDDNEGTYTLTIRVTKLKR